MPVDPLICCKLSTMNLNNQVKAPPSTVVPLFLHMPKTAGITLASMYFEYKADEYYQVEDGFLCERIHYYPAGLEKNYYPVVPDKSPDNAVATEVQDALVRTDIRAVVGHFSFDIHKYLRLLSTYLRLLRNPLERVVSVCHHIRKYSDVELHERIVSEEMSIEDFVFKLGCKAADNDHTRRIAGRNPDFGTLTTATLHAAKGNLERHVSVVDTTESFDETLILIRRLLNWTSEPYCLPGLVNRSRAKATPLSQRTTDAILGRNELDLNVGVVWCPEDSR